MDQRDITLLSVLSQSTRARSVVPRYLSRQQVEQYHQQGFLAPVDVMSEDVAVGYLRQLQAAEAEYPAELSAKNRNNPHLAFSFLEELVHHPIILDLVGDLIGGDFALAERERANRNCTDILYQGASRGRAY
jgi:hypothetical protein